MRPRLESILAHAFCVRRFLLSPDRAAELAGEDLANLVPVHEDFLVIALGSPDRGALLEEGVVFFAEGVKMTIY